MVEDNTTRKGRMFDYGIQVLILVSLVSFSVETLPGISPLTLAVLNWIELISVILFTMEYIMRIYVARQPFRYIFSFYGLIDLAAILPFYLSKTLDLRSLRAFRIFRVFRSLKLIRYNKALARFHRAAGVDGCACVGARDQSGAAAALEYDPGADAGRQLCPR